jgi:hypothetical protein
MPLVRSGQIGRPPWQTSSTLLSFQRNQVSRLEPALARRALPLAWPRKAASSLRGSASKARAILMNSTTSSRRSPPSYLATKDCGFFSRRARACCVMPDKPGAAPFGAGLARQSKRIGPNQSLHRPDLPAQIEPPTCKPACCLTPDRRRRLSPTRTLQAIERPSLLLWCLGSTLDADHYSEPVQVRHQLLEKTDALCGDTLFPPIAFWTLPVIMPPGLA